MVKNRLVLIINFLEDLNENFVYGAGDVSCCLEQESAPGPWPSGAGAAQKSGGSATLLSNIEFFTKGSRPVLRIWND